MNTLPSQGLLASYWIPQVGIGPQGRMDNVDVPLTDVLLYKLPNGKLHTNVVFLASASFISSSAPYVTIPEAIAQQMTLQSGQSRTNVQLLQAAGIKVLLTLRKVRHRRHRHRQRVQQFAGGSAEVHEHHRKIAERADRKPDHEGALGRQ